MHSGTSTRQAAGAGTLPVHTPQSIDARCARTAPVSVVVPCYRCADTILAAIASVAAQTLPPAEVILVDDCSGDDTLARLHEVAAAYPAGWVNVLAMPRNGGPSGARNRGWEHAGQDYVAFLDSDDTWHPQKLAIQMQVLHDDPQIALLAHPMNVQPRTAPPPSLRLPLKVRVMPRHLLLVRSPVPTASIVLRRDLPFRFDENRMRAEDFLLWAQILLSGYRCVRINQVLASWHKPPFGAGGLSGDLDAMYHAARDVRSTLHAQGLLSRQQMVIGDVMSVLRHARRQVITLGRRLATSRHAAHTG